MTNDDSANSRRRHELDVVVLAPPKREQIFSFAGMLKQESTLEIIRAVQTTR